LARNALVVWQVESIRDKKEYTGGFTRDEIDPLTMSNLKSVVQLLLAKGRDHGTFQTNDAPGPKVAAEAWLEICEKASEHVVSHHFGVSSFFDERQDSERRKVHFKST
jgi:hypothetical protein